MLREMVAPYIVRPVAEDFLITLGHALKASAESPLVFHAWGVGGVGKSTLLKKAGEANPQWATATVSFGMTEGIDEPIGLMQTLHAQLRQILTSASAKPDPFSERYQQYFDTIHQLKTESEDGKGAATPEQIELVKKGVGWAAKGAGEFFLPSIAAETLGKLGEATVEGARLALSEKDRLVDLVQRHRATKDKRELQELILQPVPKLTAALVASLMLWGKQRPILLLLDTYEKAPVDIDNWLWRLLLGNHPELRTVPVRVLVMGRHCILNSEGWRKLQQDRAIVHERALEQFDSAQTQDYLQRIGITDPVKMQQIWQVTKGLPYYLNWIREQKEKRRELNFAEGNQEIAKLLLQGLDQTRQKVIQLAACCRWFDRSLLEFLAQQYGLAIEFDWLVQQSFVEMIGHRYRLDDVARDVFRQAFWQSDRAGFERIFDLLMRYFKSLSDREVPSNVAPPDRYENPDWRDLRTEYLYYLLFTRQQNLQLTWLTHLLEARYFNQDELVQVPLQSLDSEADLANHPYLSYPTRQFLQQLRPAIEHGWAVLEQDPIDYPYNQEKHGLSRAATHKAIDLCLGQIEQMTGLAKFAALFYRSKRCPEAQRLEWLQKAKAQAEQIATATHPDFSSGLFLWKIGNALSDLGREEEAISSYDQAIAIKPDKYNAWNNRGDVLQALGRNDEALDSYDRAIAINPDYRFPHKGRGTVLMQLGRYDEALASYDRAIALKPGDAEAHYDKARCLALQGNIAATVETLQQAIALNPDYRDLAQMEADFDRIRSEERFQALIDA